MQVESRCGFCRQVVYNISSDFKSKRRRESSITSSRLLFICIAISGRQDRFRLSTFRLSKWFSVESIIVFQNMDMDVTSLFAKNFRRITQWRVGDAQLLPLAVIHRICSAAKIVPDYRLPFVVNQIVECTIQYRVLAVRYHVTRMLQESKGEHIPT